MTPEELMEYDMLKSKAERTLEEQKRFAVLQEWKTLIWLLAQQKIREAKALQNEPN